MHREKPVDDGGEESSQHPQYGDPTVEASPQDTSSDILDNDDDDSIAETLPAYEPSDQGREFHREALRFDARFNRINIDIDSNAHRISKLLHSLQSQTDLSSDPAPPFPSASIPVIDVAPRALNIVIQVVGSRGDIQPFISLGLTLKGFGHRIRIATHPAFKKFVEGVGLEFFSIGGDPAELMAFMVKNPGLLPKMGSLRDGEVQRRRKMMRNIMRSCWHSCFETGNGLHEVPEPASKSSKTRRQSTDSRAFVADAIIANPPSFAHIHCAEKLGIPLHLMFTMPWSPTQAFAHPLANVRSSNTDVKLSNYISYLLVELVIWQGLGDVINRFRRKRLGLEPWDPTSVLGTVSRLKIPSTYCWSPSLIPKPRDWASHINVAGFFFLPPDPDYKPSAELFSFLDSGAPPIYIGFGSIVVDDPDGLTSKVLEAVKHAGVRAIVSKGWGGLGESAIDHPPNVFFIDDCPHSWLFKRVSCVVHHGGAGTTAAAIAAGKSMVAVPFFGDQLFWGNMTAQAGVGPKPIPYEMLTASDLADAINAALEPTRINMAHDLAAKINDEDGSKIGANYFHSQLPVDNMGCSVMDRRVAVWRVPKTNIKLSALAATVLRKAGLVDFRSLQLFRPCEYDSTPGPLEPVTGATRAILDLFYDVFKGIGEIGSEFVHVPYVGELPGKNNSGQQSTKSHSSSDACASIRYPNEEKRKIVGTRAAKGTARMVKAAARAPMTFTVAMAQGSHNAPKLWNDKTVRPPDPITGLGSGLKAGVKELFLGTYDGVAGLITQPVKGVMEDGPLGLFTGAAKGVAGTPFKFWAAMNGIVGYPLKGLDVEISKMFAHDTQKAIISARLIQGEREYLDADEEQKTKAIEQWHQVQAEEAKLAGKSIWKGKGKARDDGSSGT